MTFLLGIDGGNSKTLAVLADETGWIHGIGRSGGSNHQSSQGLKHAMAQVRLAAERALQSADIGDVPPEVAFCCMAGADLPEDFGLLLPALQDLCLAANTGLDNDTVAALRSATDAPNAVVVVWGSGTNAMGRNAAGACIRLPGLGWISGDWGGGATLTQEAIALVARAHDGRGEATMLTPLVLAALDVPDADEMIRKLYFTQAATLDSGDGAVSLDDREDENVSTIHLTPLIFQAAHAGDPVACNLVTRSGLEVATTAVALLRRLELLDRPADVVLAGSVFKGEGSILLDTVRTQLALSAPRCRIVVPVVEPAIGALYCAMDRLGISVGTAVRERARESYEFITRRIQAEVRI